MLDKASVRLVLIAAALLGAHSVHDPSSVSAQDARAPVTAAVHPRDARSTAIVDGANAFLATLSNQQKATVLFDFKDAEQRVRWSNLPVGLVRRTGMAWGDMDAAQRVALMKLLGAVLGSDGVENVQEQMAADDVLRASAGDPGSRGPGSGAPGRGAPANPPTVNFGSDYYYVAFLGAPSTTAPWMLQFGGHHLGINATVAGPNLTLSPSLTGGQPLKFMVDGRPVYIVLKEAVQGTALLNSLTDAQRERAVISTQFIDLVLGRARTG